MNKILVVDDDPDILSPVERILTMHNFSVETLLKWEAIDKNSFLGFYQVLKTVRSFIRIRGINIKAL